MSEERRILPERLASLGYQVIPHPRTPAIIPPLVTIPAGPFQMGSDRRHDPDARDHEEPRHTVELREYQIAKYPVTVAEYALAVQADAVSTPVDHFATTWEWKLEHPDHPVSFVRWTQAAAYIEWLRSMTRQAGWRLPTEAEWEKAARWDPQTTTSRRYPWGYRYDEYRCNADNTIGATTPVGSYPASDPDISGASPYGVEEMAGNVLEWTSARLAPYPYTPNDGREDPGPPMRWVIRGGWWGSPPENVRAAHRGEARNDDVYYCGFRLAYTHVW